MAALCARHLTDPAALGPLATLEAVRWTTAPFAVQATHRLRLPVRQVTLQIGAQPQTFTALGPELLVPELHHAASRLLAHNLLLYGIGGIAAPFLCIKLLDMLLGLFI